MNATSHRWRPSQLGSDAGSAAGTEVAGADPGELATSVGGPFDACTWSTGSLEPGRPTDGMRIFVWRRRDDGPVGPWFGFSVAWPLDTEEPDRALDNQIDRLERDVGDGTRVGGAFDLGGFCQLAEATCPGWEPSLCDLLEE